MDIGPANYCADKIISADVIDNDMIEDLIFNMKTTWINDDIMETYTDIFNKLSEQKEDVITALVNYLTYNACSIGYYTICALSETIGKLWGCDFGQYLLNYIRIKYYASPLKENNNISTAHMKILDAFNNNFIFILNVFLNSEVDTEDIINQLTNLYTELYNPEYPYMYLESAIEKFARLISLEDRNLLKFYLLKNTDIDMFKFYLKDYREEELIPQWRETRDPMKIHVAIMLCGEDEYISSYLDQFPIEKQNAWMEFMLGI